MDHPTFSVAALVAALNQTLEFAYPHVVVEGEVASFKVNKSKFVFFDIKDNEAAVNCFMMVYQLRIPLEDGMKVRLIAQPRVTPWGKFSLTVREVLPMGEGTIKRAFDLLKTKLDNEGLFDPSRKRILPHIPRRIGLIASTESAGFADFIKITNQRWSGLHVDVANVQVQGMGAAEQVIRAIDYFNQQSSVPDVLVIVRGGGSADDLAVFNDENLVRAVAGSRVPTLVGVGHEVDTSLCDLAADVRAATPSNAAQILVPDRTALLAELLQRKKRLAERITSHVKEVQIHTSRAALHMIDRLQYTVTDQLRHVAQAELLLKQLDPVVVLQRGYSLVRDAKGTLVRGRATNIKPGDQLTVTTEYAIMTTGVINVKRS